MISIVDFGSKKTPLIGQMVQELGYKFRIVEWTQPWSEEQHAFTSGIIFSGSPTMFTETDPQPYFDRFQFIREGKIPVLGICFGHQFVGLLHDAQIFRGPEVRTEIDIHIVKEDVLFQGLSPVTKMTEDHTEGITLPPSFIHLGYSEAYAVEAMRHPVLPIWGVQFHPEVSHPNGKKLLANFLDQTGKPGLP